MPGFRIRRDHNRTAAATDALGRRRQPGAPPPTGMSMKRRRARGRMTLWLHPIVRAQEQDHSHRAEQRHRACDEEGKAVAAAILNHGASVIHNCYEPK